MPDSDRESQPGDGPDYHADHAAWERRRAADLCATVGCNHRRDEHTLVREEGIDWHVCYEDDDCLDFTEPLTVAEPKFKTEYGPDVTDPMRPRYSGGVQTHFPTVAERDGSAGCEALARATLEAEMIAEGLVQREDGALMLEASGHEFMVEVRVLEVTGA